MAVRPAPTRVGVPRAAFLGGARLSRAVVGVGACAVGGYLLVSGELAHDLWYSAVGLISTVVMVIATCRRQSGERSGWYLLAAANALFVLGDGVYDIYDLVLHRATPFPSVADALYLAGYPILFIGVARTMQLRSAPGAREARADAAMVSVGAVALFWQLLMGPYAHNAALGLVGKVVNLAYPVMDLGVLFIILNAMMVRSARRPVDRLLALAIAIMLLADFSNDLLMLHPWFTGSNALDAAFLANYVLMAAAAAHPSAAQPLPRTETEPNRRLWLPLVAVAAFVSPAVVLVCSIMRIPVDAGVLAGISVTLAVLAVLRAHWLFGRLRQQANELDARGTSLQEALATQQALERDLRHQAFHDHLTGLPNRALLHDRIEHALAAAHRQPGVVALCFCDLDGFKAVNDGSGHHVGDALLVAVSKRITSVLRPGDTVARLGGDEFAVLLENVDDMDAVTELAERVVSALRHPIFVDGQSIAVSISVGVAFAGPGGSTETLLAEADTAMYEAKANGKNGVAIFQTEMRSRLVDRMTLMNSFQTALLDGEFHLQFQPQVRLADSSLEGFEALVRWQHPTLGAVEPLRFVPLAEETGFIIPLGRWVLEQACIEAACWPEVDGPLTVSVNVSGRQLQHPEFCQDVRTVLGLTGLAPQRLVLEITESVLMIDPGATAAVLASVKELGVRIAIDDFGTGYSSLAYLRQFPADILKIDKTFIDPLDDPSTDTSALVQTILRLAADLHLKVTAEGIEYARQREILEQLHCDSAQGYLMSRPLSPPAARSYIADAQAHGVHLVSE